MVLSRRLFVRSFVVVAAMLTAGAGCTDFSSTPESLGHLIVTAKDANGAPVAGIKFTALLADRATPWAVVTTGSSGSAEFRESDGGILPQTYVVRFDATTPGYRLVAGEVADKPITVVVGQTHTISYTVEKAGPGGGPG
jgi:hypothetical protein